MMRPRIGVMGSAAGALSEEDRLRLFAVADTLGRIIVERNCVLITGATTGVPDMVSRAVQKYGGFAVGISPAMGEPEHVERYGLPPDGCDLIIHTGFGLKGRNVINIRSSDIVIIFGGAMGTLNEFTIAHDEGKVIGVLEGTGGVADHIKEIAALSKKPTHARLVFDSDPVALIDRCLDIIRAC